MKLKHLLLAAFAVISSGAWAQTDVTSTYLTNPSFETGTVGAITSLEGWTLPTLGSSFVNISLGNKDACEGNGFGIPQPSEGEKYYFNRRGWNSSSSESATLSTTSKAELPVGRYTLNVQYKAYDKYDDSHNVKGSTLVANVLDASSSQLGTKSVNFNNGKGNANFNTLAWSDLTVTFDMTTAGNVTINLVETLKGGVRSDVVLDNLTLSWKSLQDFSNDLETKKSEAVALLANNEYACVTGSERTALTNASTSSATAETIEAYETATNAVQTAMTNFTNAKPNYVKFDNEKANALAMGVDENNVVRPASSSNDDLTTALHGLYVLEDQASKAGYTVDATNIFGSWTQQNVGSASGQHWSGDSRSYMDKWQNSGFSMSVNNTTTLPEGKYVFKAAARMAKGGNNYRFNMCVKVGEGEQILENFVDNGDSGFGIDKTGAANYSDTPDTYCNDNKGRGWEWRFIAFEVPEGGASVRMEIGANVYANNWVGFTDITLLTTTENEAIKLDLAKQELQAAIAAAPVVPHSSLIGDGAFQYPTSAASAYSTALTDAQTAYDDAEATSSSVNTAISNLAAAIATFEGSMITPAAAKRFHLVNDRGAVTYTVNPGQSQGGYDLSFATVNNNYAQAFKLTQVSGNVFTLSFVDEAGTTRYICNGVVYGAGTGAYGIRVTDDSEKALQIKVVATNVEGKYNLMNTSTGAVYQKLGATNDGGLYTADTNSAWTISEASKASANLKITDAKYGTFIAPFAAAIPSGVTAYKVSELDGEVLTLVEDNDGFDANAPYIVYSESTVNQNLEGWGLATKNTYIEGLLTGVYAETAAENGWYVLQNNNDVVGFYKVDTNDAENPTPNDLKVPANRAYLTVPAASANVRAFRLDNNASAIEAISAIANNAIETIYNANGVKVNALQKGINVVKMQNGMTQKVLVK